MNKLIRKIAKEAGFIFWENESWKPEDAIIDWSTNYDQDLVKYTEILLDNLTSVVDDQAAEAIRNYYNNQDVPEEPLKETVDIELSEADLFALMKMAHKMDITFNQLCEEVLKEYIAQDNDAHSIKTPEITREEVIRLAKKAGFRIDFPYAEDYLQAFAIVLIEEIRVRNER